MRHSIPFRRVGIRTAGPVLSAVLGTLAALCGAPGAAADDGPGFADDQPVLATATVRDGTPVDGIPSGPMVSGGYHVHAHLTLFINGVEAWLPAGVGVQRPIKLDPDRADPVITEAHGFYWLHTHDESGIIHAEAPEFHAFTLGQFFDVWGQPLSRDQVGPATGAVTVLVDGLPFDGDPRQVPIKAHEAIQLNVGQDVKFRPYDFPSNL
ncbi:hypothetical protein GCM10009839_15150 [Catenulispora yoronensis]|uniref:Uncharacterized protein n=1 Tax=Catenulispora yoronensis TaxID=450799 RepID=A0ABN2TTE9_9ACTN